MFSFSCFCYFNLLLKYVLAVYLITNKYSCFYCVFASIASHILVPASLWYGLAVPNENFRPSSSLHFANSCGSNCLNRTSTWCLYTFRILDTVPCPGVMVCWHWYTQFRTCTYLDNIRMTCAWTTEVFRLAALGVAVLFPLSFVNPVKKLSS